MTLEESLNNLPDKPGVYLMKDILGRIIYVGKSACLKDRVRSYFHDSAKYEMKVAAMVPNITSFETIETANEMEALILESRLIKKYRPKYNVMYKDDKTYPYLKLTVHEDFPRLSLTRRITQDNSRYYGPYVLGSVNSLIKVINKKFKLRDCRIDMTKRLERACIKEGMGFCTAPCTGKATKETYAEQVKQVEEFLKGKQRTLIAELEKKMNKAAENLDFEEAARYRDQKDLVELILLQNDKTIGMKSQAMTDYMDRESTKALRMLKDALKLPEEPVVIDCIDISNISGKDSVGSAVRFVSGHPDKDKYRKYRIRTLSGPDDTGMIFEVVSRRLKRLKEEGDLPHLLVIDGGKGQLNAAENAMKISGVSLPIISLAKREEEVFTLDSAESIKLPKDSPALHLLQAARDEAHRFAVKYHKTLRDKRTTESVLDKVEGIGDKRKKEILGKFKELGKITREDLQSIKGMPAKLIAGVLEAVKGLKK